MDTGSQRYGGHGERETPGHIPNPEAKPLSADGTAPETGWESRTPPDKPSTKGPQPPGRGPFVTPDDHLLRFIAIKRGSQSTAAGALRSCPGGQGTVRRSPAQESPASTTASATARVTIDRSANHCPTCTHVPRAVMSTDRPPRTSSAAMISPHVPALPQRL